MDAVAGVSRGLWAITIDYAFERGERVCGGFGVHVITGQSQAGCVVGLANFGVIGFFGL
jgi:hypothetical protein